MSGVIVQQVDLFGRQRLVGLGRHDQQLLPFLGLDHKHIPGKTGHLFQRNVDNTLIQLFQFLPYHEPLVGVADGRQAYYRKGIGNAHEHIGMINSFASCIG